MTLPNNPFARRPCESATSVCLRTPRPHPIGTATLVVVAAIASGLPRNARAYPQMQAFSQKHSGRNVNCGMCHVNPEGPHGRKPGQIGALDPAQLAALAQARLAFKPGHKVHSPILNAFGNHIIETLGRTRFINLRQHPAGLAPALGNVSDLDHDGVPDAQEFLDGTDPLDPQSGPPLALLEHNLWRYRGQLGALLVITLLGLFGLNQLLQWFETRSEAASETAAEEPRPSVVADTAPQLGVASATPPSHEATENAPSWQPTGRVPDA